MFSVFFSSNRNTRRHLENSKKLWKHSLKQPLSLPQTSTPSRVSIICGNTTYLFEFWVFLQYRKALEFWSLGISIHLELFCFLSFITFVLRNMCSCTHRRNSAWKEELCMPNSNMFALILYFRFGEETIRNSAKTGSRTGGLKLLF